MALGSPESDPEEVRDRAIELSQQIQSLLSTAGIPHTPWLLLVVLEQKDQSDAPVFAAKNGNYGHLYHALITVALARSQMTTFDLSGKFLYLAGLAHHLYTANKGTMSDAEAVEFHKEHCERFDLPFGYEQVRDDLIQTRILRRDGEEIAFCGKWFYSFFIAY